MNAATGVSRSARIWVHTGTTVCSFANSMNSAREGVMAVPVIRLRRMLDRNMNARPYGTRPVLLGPP